MEKLLKNKLFYAFLANLLLISFEFVGLILSVERHGFKVFEYYTENSNYFTLIVSIMFCITCVIALNNSLKIPNWVHTLRYVSSTCLTITFIIVIFVLIPMYPHTLNYMLFQNSNLYQHLLCPLLSFISFIVLENSHKITKRDIFISLIPTIVYGVICIILNLLNLMLGPYPFFYVYAIPWYVAVISLIGILLASIFIAFGIQYLRNKTSKSYYIRKSKQAINIS